MNNYQEAEVKYTVFDDLPALPKSKEEVEKSIKAGFEAPQTEWKQQFDAITLSRSLNKYEPNYYIKEIFPSILKSIVTNVDGLRSKLSKEALTLLFETIKYNNLQLVQDSTFSILVDSLFRISNSQKKFIKQQARAAITELQNTKHPGIYSQLALMTLKNNFNISQLAITSLKKKVEKDMISSKNLNFSKFLKLVISNLNAGRAVLQKTAKDIINIIRVFYTNKVFQQILNEAELTVEQRKLVDSSILQKQSKGIGSFKDFLKNKKDKKDIEQ